MKDQKVCDMPAVREYGNPSCGNVELWRDGETGRLVVRAFNEGGFNCTDVDAEDLLSWLSASLADWRKASV